MRIIIAIAAACFIYPYGGLTNPVARTERRSQNATSVWNEKRLVVPSEYPLAPGPFPHEWRYLNWDPTNVGQQDILQKIHTAFEEVMVMAALALLEVDKSDKTVLTRWFNTQDDPGETKAVFANIYDEAAGQATINVENMVLYQNDFANRCTPTMRAYTVPATGRFHLCPAGLNLPLNEEILCQNLDPSCSLQMRSTSMTILHEMTHFDDIGAAGHANMAIIDEASGAYNCFILNTDKKGDNAQNYAWLAGEAYWSNYCKKTFEDPKPGVQ